VGAGMPNGTLRGLAEATGAELHAGQGAQLGTAAAVGDPDPLAFGFAVVVADVVGAMRLAAVDGGPHMRLSQTRSPLQSVSL